MIKNERKFFLDNKVTANNAAAVFSELDCFGNSKRHRCTCRYTQNALENMVSFLHRKTVDIAHDPFGEQTCLQGTHTVFQLLDGSCSRYIRFSLFFQGSLQILASGPCSAYIIGYHFSKKSDICYNFRKLTAVCKPWNFLKSIKCFVTLLNKWPFSEKL